MLKIKDNVDLKELEKFGFELDNEINWYFKQITWEDGDVYHYIVRDDRVIGIENNVFFCFKIDNTIYDLTKADLIEKVGD